MKWWNSISAFQNRRLPRFALCVRSREPSAAPASTPPTIGRITDSPVHFTYQPIPFQLDSSETPERHAPETMAGGVAVFDYNNDGKLDIFFTNGADIKTLKKSSSKY